MAEPHHPVRPASAARASVSAAEPISLLGLPILPRWPRGCVTVLCEGPSSLGSVSSSHPLCASLTFPRACRARDLELALREPPELNFFTSVVKGRYVSSRSKSRAKGEGRAGSEGAGAWGGPPGVHTARSLLLVSRCGGASPRFLVSCSVWGEKPPCCCVHSWVPSSSGQTLGAGPLHTADPRRVSFSVGCPGPYHRLSSVPGPTLSMPEVPQSVHGCHSVSPGGRVSPGWGWGRPPG